ncbi:type II toxin-antitoxin system VapC family toxin [Leifsonia sp. 2MCAF36]|uniref:type II toxin-antitoxin system VapC family toxin n=1 Tax=Leifsonia sp. 2MCAF36 TaxID=3232988 RepID=UPI003F9AC130
MKWLIDTMVLSATRRPDRADAAVVRWLESQNPYSLHLSAMTVFEIELGAARKERSDPEQGADLRVWIDEVLEAFAERILPVDQEVAAVAAGYHVPDPRPQADALIAATAEVNGLAVVTRNTRNFRTFRVPLFSPWESGA